MRSIILLLAALLQIGKIQAVEYAQRSSPCNKCKCHRGPTGPTGPMGAAGTQINAFFSAYADSFVLSDDAVNPGSFLVPLSNVQLSSFEDFLFNGFPATRIALVKPGTYFITFGGSLAGISVPGGLTSVLTLSTIAGPVSGGSIDLTSRIANGNLVSTSVILRTTQANQILQLETFFFDGTALIPRDTAFAPTGDNANSIFISILRLN